MNLLLIFLSILLFSQESFSSYCFNLINAKELFNSSHEREIDISRQFEINNYRTMTRHNRLQYPRYSLVKKRERPFTAIIKLIVSSSPIGSFYTATNILIEKILIKKTNIKKIFNLH